MAAFVSKQVRRAKYNWLLLLLLSAVAEPA